jgi:hypothetical protein
MMSALPPKADIAERDGKPHAHRDGRCCELQSISIRLEG